MPKLIALLCTAVLLTGQEKEHVISETFKFVLVPVTVTDKNGNFVNGLTQYDFRLLDNGKQQRITEDIASHPISLVVGIQANNDVEKILPQIQKLGSVFEQLVVGENGEMAVLVIVSIALLVIHHGSINVQPFNPARLPGGLKGLGVGFAASFGNERGATTSVYKTYGMSTWFSGKATCAPYLSRHVLGDPGEYRMFPTISNGQPAAVTYRRHADGSYLPFAIAVLATDGSHLTGITAFVDPRLIERFGFPTKPPTAETESDLVLPDPRPARHASR